MVELNVPYGAKELADNLFGVSYGTFRNNKQKYLDKLSECYEWKYEKRKYILTAFKQDYTPDLKRSEKLYQEVYLPRVIDYIGDGLWTTGRGITINIYEAESDFFANEVKHMMSTAYNYVLRVLGDKYDITDKQYAKCYGQGEYSKNHLKEPDFMTQEEIDAWNETKSQQSEEVGKRIIELTEKWAYSGSSKTEYLKEVGEIASKGFVLALAAWIKERHYIPVRLNYYEPKQIASGAFIMEDFDF